MTKQKNIALISLSILSLIILVGMVSATALTISSLTSGKIIYDNEGSFNFTFEITYKGQEEEASINFTKFADFGEKSLDITMDNLTKINGTEGKPQLVKGEIKGFNDMGAGEINVKIRADASDGNSTEGSFSIKVRKTVDFCEGKNDSGLEVKIDRVSVISGFGEKDEYWYPLDEVEIRLDIKNEGEWDLGDLEIGFCLYDHDAGKCILDERDIDIEEDDFYLDRKDKLRTYINFNIDPDELTPGNEDYEYYVYVTGKIDDKKTDRNGERICSSDNKYIEIKTTDSFVVIDNFRVNKEKFLCGETVTINADVWNIGNKDLDEDDVFVWIYSKELGIDQTINFSRGIDAMNSEKLGIADYSSKFLVDAGISFVLPKDLEEKTYRLDLIVFDNQKMRDRDIYKNRAGDKAEYSVYFQVEGGCYVKPEAEMIASLESDAKAGENLTVLISVTNVGDKVKTYSISATGYESWASVLEVSNNMILAPGEFANGYIIFEVNKDVSEKQTFDIRINDEDGKLVLIQPYEVTVEAAKRGFFDKITWNSVIENKYTPYLAGIGVLNILLILAIVILAIRIAKKRKQ